MVTTNEKIQPQNGISSSVHVGRFSVVSVLLFKNTKSLSNSLELKQFTSEISINTVASKIYVDDSYISK